MILTNLTSQYFTITHSNVQHEISPGDNIILEDLTNNFFVKLMVAQRKFRLDTVVEEDLSMSQKKNTRSNKSK